MNVFSIVRIRWPAAVEPCPAASDIYSFTSCNAPSTSTPSALKRVPLPILRPFRVSRLPEFSRVTANASFLSASFPCFTNSSISEVVNCGFSNPFLTARTVSSIPFNNSFVSGLVILLADFRYTSKLFARVSSFLLSGTVDFWFSDSFFSKIPGSECLSTFSEVFALLSTDFFSSTWRLSSLIFSVVLSAFSTVSLSFFVISVNFATWALTSSALAVSLSSSNFASDILWLTSS